jgi:hypothetical protein
MKVRQRTSVTAWPLQFRETPRAAREKRAQPKPDDATNGPNRGEFSGMAWLSPWPPGLMAHVMARARLP